nr:MAG TPA: Protein of unknown function (DUF2688) [Caudoviricetes sp.]
MGEIITKPCSGCGSNVYVNCRRFNGILYMGKECICSDCKQKANENMRLAALLS